eukprot:scaffold16499_cov121-Isochrysis_galbana.AAC.2
MGAALTYLLLELEGVDTEPDILDDGKKGPWTIFTNADCAEQFHAKHGDGIIFINFNNIPIEFTITYGELETKKGGAMGKEWGRGGGVSGRQEGRGAQPCRR